LFIIKDVPVTKTQCLVFAYGATGAGKTFTMLGSKTSPGITYLTIVELYRQMETLASEREFDLAVSHLEVSHCLLAYCL
jgi:kinesin family protein 18/19